MVDLYLRALVPLALCCGASFAQSCPQGFVLWNYVCVQQTSHCPPPYQLLQGVCQIVAYGQTAQPCPTVACSSQSGSSCPAQPCAVQPCPAQPCPVQPCPVQSCSAQPCQPAQPGTSVQPCPNPPPSPVQPCPNPPPAPVQPCPSPPPSPVQPYPLPPPATESPYTTTTTTLPPPPAEIKRCPPGTILVQGVCRLIYCGKGIFQDNKCIQAACPAGTVWTGLRCAPPRAPTHSVSYSHTVVSNFNRTESVVVNNNNNVLIHIAMPTTTPTSTSTSAEDATVRPEDETCGQDGCGSNGSDESDKKCCTVYTPRMCRRRHERQWTCFRRRYRRCGDFCTAPTMQLMPRHPMAMGPMLTMPSNPGFRDDCHLRRNCPPPRDFYDCSGCAAGVALRCSTYCYSYSCSSQRCHYYDQESYCSEFPGEEGCQQQDGCLDDWCQ